MNHTAPKDLAQLIAPVWSGDTVYEESFLPLAGKGADKAAALRIPLLYHAEEILSVTDMRREKTFEAGKDYLLEGGALVIPADSAIARLGWDDYQLFDESLPQPHFLCEGGGFLLFREGSFFHGQEYCVTYRHKDAWDGFIPKGDAGKLPRVKKLLADGKPVSFCWFGDSITTGANSSGNPGIHVPPYTPMFPQMTVLALEAKYGSEIRYVNHAVGGTVSGWGCEQLPKDFAGERPDVMFIGFGMNDASGKIDAKVVAANIRTMMEQTLAINPDCEFLICSTTLPNPLASTFVGNHEEHEPLFAEICRDYGARAQLVPVTSMHKALLAKKHFYDMTGNNINHPNDFLARIYTQVILSVLA